MVKIEATLDRTLLNSVSKALQEIGIPGLTVSEVRVEAGDGRGRHVYRGSLHGVFRGVLRLEVVVSDEMLEAALATMTAAMRTTASDDVRLVVTPVSEAVRIRTGDRGGAAVAG